MWLMLQQEEPDDYVLGTGESHSVREFVERAFHYAGIEIEWMGTDIEEKGIVKSLDSRWDYVLKPGQILIEIDPRYLRPTEVEHLQADIRKAKEKLGWEPRVSFSELIMIMVDYDLLRSGIQPPGEGIKICQQKGFHYTNHEVTYVLNKEKA